MTVVALGLVLAAAILHSGWNLMAKRAADQLLFLWLAIVAGVIVFTPGFLIVIGDNPIPMRGWLLIGASSVIHVAYFALLAGAYSRTDLSIAYPLARGTGPLFVLIFSVAILQERPSPLGIIGIIAVVVGVFLVQAQGLSLRALGAPFRALMLPGPRLALLTGLSIGVYSMVDKLGVGYVHPVAYMYLWVTGTAIIMAPAMLPRLQPVMALARSEAGWIVAGGTLMFGAYILVLTAMTTTNVSYVAATRETSIVLAALYGGLLLREGMGIARIVGAVSLAVGVALIGVGG